MRSKLEAMLSRIYLPSSREVLKNVPREVLEKEESALPQQQKFELASELEYRMKELSPIRSPREKLWLDEVSKADARAERFREELALLKRVREDCEVRIQSLEGQVDAREQEIQRLQELYVGGQSLDMMSLRYVKEENENTIAKLNRQLDIINAQNTQMQSELDRKNRLSEVGKGELELRA